ncbi:MAG: NAD-dependent deacylase [Acidobacteria bacterium]|nr:NAD-dependent deacylase [Acidobacteriota bacterium]
MKELLERLSREKPERIVALTGAGISAESGIPTFRSAGGLWNTFKVEDLATPEAFARNPDTVWQWYESRRAQIRGVEPNAAHHALGRLGRHPRVDLTVITQNVDDLHERAGSNHVLHLHGSIFRVRCCSEGNTFDRREAFDVNPPRCDCGSLLRPDVVWFGEPLDLDTLNAASAAVERAELLIVIGTSATVYPAAGLAWMCRGYTIEINPVETSLTGYAQLTIRSTASNAVPPIVDTILGAADG